MEESSEADHFQHPSVEGVFAAYPDTLRRKLMALRRLIFDTAAEIENVGPLAETLKWGQPSYLTRHSGSGTTIRIDRIKSQPEHYGMFVHCQTSLISTYRELYGDVLKLDGKRCINLDQRRDPPRAVMRHCIALALTYHLDKAVRINPSA